MWENISQKDFYSFWHGGSAVFACRFCRNLPHAAALGGLIMNTDSKSYKKYAKKIRKAEKCTVYESAVNELFSCEELTAGGGIRELL